MTITLSPDIEIKVRKEADRLGVDASTYVERLIEKSLPTTTAGRSLADLFAEWEAKDGTDDSEEIARREREVAEFQEAMNRNRLEMEGPQSRKLFS